MKKPRIESKILLENLGEKFDTINVTASVPFAHTRASSNGTHSVIGRVFADLRIRN